MSSSPTTEPATAPASERPDDTDAIGWVRAILSGLAVLVVGLGATVIGANLIITKLTGISRDNAAYLASAWFLVVLVLLAVILRRLQRRALI
jgi:hypothetical protein